MSKKVHDKTCACGSGNTYGNCCGKYIDHDQLPSSPESLMRSRYTAYCQGNEAYLLSTWHQSTRPSQLGLGNQPNIKWVSLEILETPEVKENEGYVEFIARFKEYGRADRLKEKSRFVFEDGKWFYVDGETG